MLEEAFNNPIRKGNCFVVGKTSLGFDVMIIFKKDAQGISVKTAYPAYNGDFDGNKLVKMLGESYIKRKA